MFNIGHITFEFPSVFISTVNKKLMGLEFRRKI